MTVMLQTDKHRPTTQIYSINSLDYLEQDSRIQQRASQIKKLTCNYSTLTSKVAKEHPSEKYIIANNDNAASKRLLLKRTVDLKMKIFNNSNVPRHKIHQIRFGLENQQMMWCSSSKWLRKLKNTILWTGLFLVSYT